MQLIIRDLIYRSPLNKNQVIEFYKAGQLTPEEQEQVIALVRKYSN